MTEHSLSLPTVEISLDNLLHNLGSLRTLLPRGADIMAVVKDNAYGCGSRMVALTLEREGNVRFFAVARPAEAFYLRDSGVKSPILVLGSATIEEIRQGHYRGVTFTLNDLADIAVWKGAGVPVRFHCNIDTRMHRLGLMPGEIGAAADAVKRSPSLSLLGAFTHLANADEPGTPTVADQLKTFFEGVAAFRRSGLDVATVHCANSAGLIRYGLPEGCTLARPGIALYGCAPDPARKFSLDIREIASLTCRVVKIKTVPPHTPVSYGGTFTTDHATVIATVALGYGNGYPRSLGNRGALLIGGRRLPIVGRVTMDYCMVDAGDGSGIAPGDEAIAIGSQGSERITADEIALQTGTIGYEILCNLSQSLDRVYLRDNNRVAEEKGRIF